MGFLFGHGGAYKKAEQNWDKYADEFGSYYKAQAAEGINATPYQQALAAEREILKNNLQTTAATSALTGGTAASQALAKQQATDAIAEATSRMAVQANNDQMNAMQNYQNVAKQATEGKNSALISEAQAQSQAMGGLIKSGFDLAGKFVKPI